MKAKFGAIVTDGRGKLSGHIFQQGRSGSIMRRKTSPLMRRTSKQQSNKALIASLSSSWSSLAVSQRESWDLGVKNYSQTDSFGDVQLKSGFSLYVQSNCNLYNSGQTLLSSIQPKLEIPFTGTADVYVQLSTARLDIDFGSDYLIGNSLILYASPLVNNGVSAPSSFSKKIGFSIITASFVQIAGIYELEFGSVPLFGNFAVGFKIVTPSGNSSKTYFFKPRYIP